MPPSSSAPVRLVLSPADVAPAPHPASASDASAAPAPEGQPAPQTIVLRAEGEHVVIEAASRLTLRVGASALTLDADGTIVLHGVRVTVAADEALDAVSAGAHTVRGAAVHIN